MDARGRLNRTASADASQPRFTTFSGSAATLRVDSHRGVEMDEISRDPVCGMEIVTGWAVESAVSEGRRFYFCCRRCQAAFLDTPHAFVGWPGEAPDPSSQRLATSTNPRLEPCAFMS